MKVDYDEHLTERNYSLDLLRILACIGVIVIHSAGSPIFHNLCEPETIWYKECMIMDGLFRWSVPVFAMLTGFFLLDPQKELPLSKLFGKYLARITSALVVWSVFYSFTLHNPMFPLGSQAGHLWYLEMLIWVYLSLPVLRLVVRYPTVLEFVCVCWLLLMVYRFISYYVLLPIRFDCGVVFEYAGYCLSAYFLKIKAKDLGGRKIFFILFYFLGLFGLLATVLCGVLAKDGSTMFYSYTSPTVLLTSLALFSFFINHPIHVSKPIGALIEAVSKLTFGVYLIHMWILIQLFSRVHRFIPQPIPLCFICVCIVFGGGFAISWGLKRIPILNRFIV